MTRRLKWLLALFLAFDLAALATVLAMRHHPSEVARSWKGTSTGTADIGGPFALETAAGAKVTDQTYRGKWMVVYFGYTSCPDACPTALNNISVALEKLGKTADKIQPLFITVDPERDKPPVMSAFLESFDPRIVGLLGTRAQIDAVANAYRVFFKLHKEQGDNYLVDHSAYFYLMGPDGKFVDIVEGATPGDQIAAKVAKLIANHSS